jgi:hypothetical protein
MKHGKENRSYPRAIEDLELWYSTGDSAEKYQTSSKDFSATGLSYITERPYPVGTILNIELYLKRTEKIIKTKATVLRNLVENSRNIVSVQFYDIDYHDFITLLDYSLIYHIQNT